MDVPGQVQAAPVRDRALQTASIWGAEARKLMQGSRPECLGDENDPSSDSARF